MVELVTDRLVIATPGERHIDEVFRIMSTRCLAERTGFKKMDDVSEAEGKSAGPCGQTTCSSSQGKMRMT